MVTTDRQIVPAMPPAALEVQTIQRDAVTTVCLKDAIKFTPNPPIWRRTWERTLARNLTNVSGKVALGSLLVQTSWRDITENTRAWDPSNVRNVNDLFHGPIIYLCIWNDILVKWKSHLRSLH